MIPFEELFSEAQVLREPTTINILTDERHIVRVSVRETDESQKMQLMFALKGCELKSVYEIKHVSKDLKREVVQFVIDNKTDYCAVKILVASCELAKLSQRKFQFKFAGGVCEVQGSQLIGLEQGQSFVKELAKDENGDDLATLATEDHQEVTFLGQTTLQRPFSVVQTVVSGDIRIVPIIAIDFSMGNLTFDRDINLHTADLKKNNSYRDYI